MVVIEVSFHNRTFQHLRVLWALDHVELVNLQIQLQVCLTYSKKLRFLDVRVNLLHDHFLDSHKQVD